MNFRIKALATALTLSAALSVAGAQHASASHWAASWVAPAEPLWNSDFALPLGMPEALEHSTLQQYLRTSIGGNRIRLVVSNEYGDRPLKIGRAFVAREVGSAGAPVRFDGQEGVVIAPGGRAMSDPVGLEVAALERLRVDLYLPERTRLAGFHWDARERTLLVPGDATGRTPAPEAAQAFSTRAFLSSVLVESARPPRAVVALGDSITDGNGATPGADHRWPDFAATRLAPQGVAVLNAGISGNRLLRPGMGESGLARLDKDVLQQPGVRSVIVLLGTNDIGWPGGPFAPKEDVPDAREIAEGFRQLVSQAHRRGVRVVGATIPPFEDALKGTPLEGHYSPRKEAVRQAVNAWIREAGVFDAVVDFDRLLRDPARPVRLNPAFDSGDHLHPNDAGYRAMAEALDIGAL